ncbi:hypothetical protein [Stenotrophomonas maltophilia]|uniref:hypothetical protein n=1 Tax=Stenotrophomonas maltophilia TaxID=40324 RepID=UPI003BF8204C
MAVIWEALSAVGTVGAVIVSLVLAGRQGKKDRAAQQSRARWVALELRQVLAAWRGRVTYACCASDPDLFLLLCDEEDDGERSISPVSHVSVPEDLLALYDQLHDLGEGAAPIADAIWISRQLQKLPILKALRGDYEVESLSVGHIRQFRAGMESLRQYLVQAEENVAKLTGLTAADPEREVFGGVW